MQHRKYVPFWNKYRPAVLKMMVAAANGPQQYKFMHHEIQSMDGKKKGGFGFSLKVSGSKAVNNIRDSEMAQELLSMLQGSPKGSELIVTYTYEIVLDKQLVLHVSQIDRSNEDSSQIKPN